MDTNKWINLPADIVSNIAKRLKSNHMDIRRLRAVCSSWWSSVPSPKMLPHIEVPFYIKSSSASNTPFVLAQRTLLLITLLVVSNDNTDHDHDHPTPWIIQVEETAPNKWLLVDPHMVQLPHKIRDSSDELPDHINLLDYKVIEIGRSYHLYSETIDSMMLLLFSMFGLRPPDSGVLKAIVQPDNNEIIDDDSNLLIFALFGDGSIASWKSGAESCSFLQYEGYRNIADMVKHKGKIYATVNGGRLIKIDVETCKMTELVAEPLNISVNYNSYYLVAYDQHLYLLTFYVVEVGVPIINHKVYVLNEESVKWEIANDLEGAAFFVGYDTVFPVLAKDIGLPEGANVLYFEGYTCHNSENGRDEVCSLKCYLNSDSTLINNWWPNRAPFWPPPTSINNANR